MGLSQSLAALLVLRFVGGAASAFVLIFSSTIVLERLAQLGRNELSALHFAGVGTGIAVSAALVAGLLELGQGWQSLWLASGALAFVAAVAAAALLPTLPSPATQTAGTASTVADARLRRLIMAYGLFGFGYIITATFLVAIVRATPAIQAQERSSGLYSESPPYRRWDFGLCSRVVSGSRQRLESPASLKRWACWQASFGPACSGFFLPPSSLAGRSWD
jgi:MFS family permease